MRDWTFIQIVEEMFCKCDEVEILQFVGVAWRIWLRRNKVVYEDLLDAPASVITHTKEANQAITDFQFAQRKGLSTGNPNVMHN
jgi:hypothetical protein